MLSDKAIEEFQRLYKQHFGKEISKQEAMEQGLKLIELMRIIYKSKPTIQVNEVELFE